MIALHPAFCLFLTAILVAASRGLLRQLLLLAGTAFTLWQVVTLGPAAQWTFALPTHTLTLLHVDALSQVFAVIFTVITGIGVLYALHVTRGGEHAATLTYAGAALGVVFAGDWITLFFFWEVMAVASLFVVWYGSTAASHAAGMRYLLIHILGGSLLFCGILVHIAQGGSFQLSALTTTGSSAAFWLILAGVAINAAIPPLHAWLTDAYPEASVTGSVFLSAFTTKTAVYVLLRLFPGAEVLVWAGTIMTLYGVVFAILEHDVRRLLSYHIVSQVGYMVTAVGMGTALALDGAGAHAFCHILYKALLFMGMGAVIQATGKRTLHDLGDLGQRLPIVFALYMVAAFSISGVPLFNGFISKSMIVSAAAEAHRPWQEILLTLAGVGTFLSVGLKLPYFTFLGPKRKKLSLRALPWNMQLAMSIAAFLCIWLGIQPEWLYERLPFQAGYHPYTIDHVLSSMQLLIGTGLAFWWFCGLFGNEATMTLDVDWFYRRPLLPACQRMILAAQRFGAAVEASRIAVLQAILPYLRNPYLLVIKIVGPQQHVERILSGDPLLQHHLVYDANRYRLPIGVTIFWIMVFFALAALYALGRHNLA